MVKKTIPHRKINLSTDLQAVAVSRSMHKTITFCSMHIPPSYALDSRELDNLLEQLSSPFILSGDINAGVIGSDVLG